jgi:hypothetical protein
MTLAEMHRSNAPTPSIEVGVIAVRFDSVWSIKVILIEGH